MSTDHSGFQFETDRLLLRELKPQDLDFAADMLGDPEVMRFWPRPLTRQEAADWIERHRRRYAEHGYGYWIAIRKADMEPVGQVGLLRQEFDGRAEVGLGYMLHRPHWGQGYAYEGARACLDHGFEKLSLERIVILIRAENAPSIRLARRLGAVWTGATEYSGFTHEVYAVRRGPSR